VREILIRQLRGQGLPRKPPGKIFFTVLKRSGWLLASADYTYDASGRNLEVCGAVVAIDADSRAAVLRKTPFTVTDVDVDTTTAWTPLDIADADGDGRLEAVLQGDAYEDHWFEVIGLGGGFPTLFSGLGYFL
jgi:hypothetical protein